MDDLEADIATKARKRRPKSKGAGMPRTWLNATSRPASRPVAMGRQGDTALDRFNEAQDDCVLHPTKGFRRLSVKRSRAQMIVAAIKSGRRMSQTQMREFMRHG